jgi:hypothetical protein
LNQLDLFVSSVVVHVKVDNPYNVNESSDA